MLVALVNHVKNKSAFFFLKKRILVPGIDQDTGKKDAWDGKGPTDYLKIRRQFKDEPGQGQFCCDVVPLTSGKICVGDTIQVLERIPKEYQQFPI